MSFGSLIGTVTCANCKSQYVKAELIDLSGDDGIDHVDLLCAVCGAFVRHFDVTRHIPDPIVEKLLEEIDEELS